MNGMIKRLVPVILVVLLMAAAAVACPNCKDSIPASNADSPPGVASGINASIYLMLGAFLTVLAFVLNLVVKASRTPSSRPR